MQAEVLIIWPDAGLAEELRDRLVRGQPDLSVGIEVAYPERADLERRLREKRYDALVVGPASGEGLDVLREAAEIDPKLLLAAADRRESADAMRAAMRVGVADYLTPPFETAELERAILEAARQKHLDVAAGVIVAFLPAQGGEGASTMALHAAYALTNDIGQPALLVDCDLQCGTTVFRLHLEPRYTTADAQARVDILDDLWDKLATVWEGVHILPAPDATLGQCPDMSGLDLVVQSAARRYAFVLADLPPVLCSSCFDILRIADVIQLVCEPTLTSLHLARRKLHELAAAGVDTSRVRLTIGRDGKRAVAGDKEIEKIIGRPIDWTVPNDFKAVSEAVFRGSLAPEDSELGQRLFGLAFHLIGQERKSPEQKSAGWLSGLFTR